MSRVLRHAPRAAAVIADRVLRLLDAATGDAVTATPVGRLHLLGELAVRRGPAAELLLSATGRGGLPAGFTVL